MIDHNLIKAERIQYNYPSALIELRNEHTITCFEGVAPLSRVLSSLVFPLPSSSSPSFAAMAVCKYLVLLLSVVALNRGDSNDAAINSDCADALTKNGSHNHLDKYLGRVWCVPAANNS